MGRKLFDQYICRRGEVVHNLTFNDACLPADVAVVGQEGVQLLQSLRGGHITECHFKCVFVG